MSPSIDGPGSGASGRPPGSSSSIGKLITSVGPGRSIQRMCRSAIAAVSNSTIDSSAAGLTSIWSMTNLATLINSDSETSIPDSLAYFDLMGCSYDCSPHDQRRPRAPAARRAARFIAQTRAPRVSRRRPRSPRPADAGPRRHWSAPRRGCRRCRRGCRPRPADPTLAPPGRSICVTSPVTTTFDPNPSRVRNIFICSAVVFWASSRMMNASN